MNEQIRAEFEQAAVVLGYNVEQHPIHTDMYLFSVTNDAYRLFQAAHSRYAGSGSEPFAYCFTDVNGRPKEFCDEPKHAHKQDLRIRTPLYTRPAPAVPEVAELWCVRIHGPDDVCPAPSKEIAEIGASMFNRVFSGRSEALGVLCRAVVEPWPYGADTHAEDAEKFVDEFILPPEQKSPTPAVPQVPDEYAQILEHGTPYVIQKNGMYYAHGNKGYVGRVLLAEIYTKEYAESHCDVIEECRAIPVTELLTGADEVQEYIDRLLVMRAAMLAAAQQGGE